MKNNLISKNTESYFSLDQTQLKILVEIEHILIFTRPLQIPSPNMNNNGPTDWKVNSGISQRKKN